MSEEEKYFYSDFKKIRESQNITIEDVIKSTRIQEQYIRAIEKGNFKDLPMVYTRLFLKSYCKVIGLDEHKILDQYNDYIKGNKTITNNKTPKFIENKNKMNNKDSNINNILNNKGSSYFIQPQKLLSFIFILLLTLITWITISNITEENDKKQTMLDNNKLTWEYLNKLTLIDSQNIEIEKGDQTNFIKYEMLENIKNKILITNDTKDLDLDNRVLNKYDEGEKEFNENLKFGISNGKINLFINNKKIEFIHDDKEIIGYLKINEKRLDLILKYFE